MIQSGEKLAKAKHLAETHVGVDPTVQSVFLLESENDQDDTEPIRLLEVVEGTIERGIEPVFFTADPSHGIPYASVIVEVSPNEFRRLEDKKVNFRSEVWHVGQQLASR